LTHNKGKVRATKHFKPFKLVYSEFVGERMEARERERYLKSATGRRWLREKMGIRTEGSLPD
jgi:putative endonuclease